MLPAVARDVDHLKSADRVAPAKHDIGDDRVDPERPQEETHCPATLGRSLASREDRGVELVDRNRGAGESSQLGRIAHVVGVPVR